MQAPDVQRRRLTAGQARDLSVRALRGIGYSPAQAGVLASHMLDAALCGYEYSGLPKILNLAEYRDKRQPAGPMRVAHETPLSLMLDAAGHNGMLAVQDATERVIAKAQEHGFAVAGVYNSWMSGRSAYYVEQIAQAGLIGLHTISSRPQVAPPGGAQAALGTNPIAFGFPTLADPLVIDMGTSALMFTDLALRARRGELLPEGVAIDAQGQPTRDPVAASQGAALPFGGYKGFALALAMQALGVFAGSGFGAEGAGYLLLAMRPDLMMPLERYRADLSANLARVKGTARQPGVHEIRIPSEHAFARRRANQRDGIEIDADIHEALQALAARCRG
ncbi:Ldh family oxidoreductase [Bordetella sp. BOR01]|uniref:Ldh family oxidoreductase n=1 Tax=Bordetella sp. BOR01 TaxID=2854779 RepID=UPI001C46DE1B|nr:Ldh family oxidoreductase [Bordetella sp. BOR01]MBV7484809.1 Ldh family oxidoreductase [Bordetella sp. BOR01]